MTTLVIRVACADHSDYEWLRVRCIGAVEEIVEDQREEGRLDGDVDVSWEVED